MVLLFTGFLEYVGGSLKNPHTSVLLSGIYSLRWLLLFPSIAQDETDKNLYPHGRVLVCLFTGDVVLGVWPFAVTWFELPL